MHKIVIANNKGGVGKTTTVINLAGFLSEMGHKVLAVDMDPQANLTIGLGINFDSLEFNSICEVLKDQCDINSAIHEVYPNLFILPATTMMGKVVKWIEQSKFRKYEILKFKFEDIHEYDFILIDTHRAQEDFYTLNAFSAANHIIIPAQMEFFSMAGMAQLNDIIISTRIDRLNPNIDILGILPTFYSNTNNCRKHTEKLRSIKSNEYGKRVFNTVIRKNVALSMSVGNGKPINMFDKTSIGYEDYQKFTLEVIERLNKKTEETANV
jgi:chromosome partitioning protein